MSARRTIVRAFAAIAGALLLAGSVGTTPAHAQQAAPARSKVVLQMSDGDAAKWNLALNNAKNLQTDLGAANVDIEIVAYGPGIGMLKADSVVGTRVDEALASGVKVVACENTMRGQKLTKSDMLSKASTTFRRAWSRSCRSSSRDGRTSGPDVQRSRGHLMPTVAALGAILLWSTLATFGVALCHLPPLFLTGCALTIGARARPAAHAAMARAAVDAAARRSAACSAFTSCCSSRCDTRRRSRPTSSTTCGRC